jgi:hypothetical protein
MRIKIDENLPARLKEILSNLNHDVHTTADENLTGASDDKVWTAAQKEERFLITPKMRRHPEGPRFLVDPGFSRGPRACPEPAEGDLAWSGFAARLRSCRYNQRSGCLIRSRSLRKSLP